MEDTLTNGFNPCFRGSRPRTQLPESIETELLVSILVFVEVALGRWQFNHYGAGGDEFQSLFSWKSPSDLRLRDDLHPGRGVSILVFVEVALGLELEQKESR